MTLAAKAPSTTPWGPRPAVQGGCHWTWEPPGPLNPLGLRCLTCRQGSCCGEALGPRAPHVHPLPLRSPSGRRLRSPPTQSSPDPPLLGRLVELRWRRGNRLQEVDCPSSVNGLECVPLEGLSVAKSTVKRHVCGGHAQDLEIWGDSKCLR